MELIKSIISQLGVNNTFFLQFLLVVVSYIFLSRFLFKPILGVLLTRTYKIEGLKSAADGLLVEHDKAIKNYKAKWKDYDLKAKGLTDSVIAESKIRAEKIIDKAEDDVAKYLKSNRQNIELEANKLSSELGNSSAQIEELIKNRLFGVSR